jgi:hypothetical protein
MHHRSSSTTKLAPSGGVAVYCKDVVADMASCRAVCGNDYEFAVMYYDLRAGAQITTVLSYRSPDSRNFQAYIADFRAIIQRETSRDARRQTAGIIFAGEVNANFLTDELGSSAADIELAMAPANACGLNDGPSRSAGGTSTLIDVVYPTTTIQASSVIRSS